MAKQLLLEVKNDKDFESSSPNYGTFNDNNKSSIVLKSIGRNPGVRYRELLRLSGLTNGALEYTLRILEKTNKIKVERQNGKRARYYSLGILSSESSILGHIRNESARRIVLFIMEHNPCTFIEILKHIKKAPSTLSWHLKLLSEAGIISVVHSYKLKTYRILNCDLVCDMLNRYPQSYEPNLIINKIR